MAASMHNMLIRPAKRRGAALHAVMPFHAKETIFQNEVDMLFEGKTPEEIIKISNEKSMEKMKAAEASKTEEKTDDKTEVKTDDKTAADEIKKLHEKLKEKIEKIENSAPAEQNKTDTSEKPEDKKTDEKPDENK